MSNPASSSAPPNKKRRLQVPVYSQEVDARTGDAPVPAEEPKKVDARTVDVSDPVEESKNEALRSLYIDLLKHAAVAYKMDVQAVVCNIKSEISRQEEKFRGVIDRSIDTLFSYLGKRMDPNDPIFSLIRNSMTGPYSSYASSVLRVNEAARLVIENYLDGTRATFARLRNVLKCVMLYIGSHFDDPEVELDFSDYSDNSYYIPDTFESPLLESSPVSIVEPERAHGDYMYDAEEWFVILTYSPKVCKLEAFLKYIEASVRMLTNMNLTADDASRGNRGIGYRLIGMRESDVYSIKSMWDRSLSRFLELLDSLDKERKLPDLRYWIDRGLPFHASYIEDTRPEHRVSTLLFDGFRILHPFGFRKACEDHPRHAIRHDFADRLREHLRYYEHYQVVNIIDFHWAPATRSDGAYYWFRIAQDFFNQYPAYTFDNLKPMCGINYTLLKELFLLMENRDYITYPTLCDWIVETYNPDGNGRLFLMDDSLSAETESLFFQVPSICHAEEEPETFLDWLPHDILGQQLDMSTKVSCLLSCGVVVAPGE
jgi:hypothetical protein